MTFGESTSPIMSFATIPRVRRSAAKVEIPHKSPLAGVAFGSSTRPRISGALTPAANHLSRFQVLSKVLPLDLEPASLESILRIKSSPSSDRRKREPSSRVLHLTDCMSRSPRTPSGYWRLGVRLARKHPYLQPEEVSPDKSLL